jgi:cell division protein ZapD
VILYEYPFNERIRTYLRLEHLFRRLAEMVSRDTAVDHHYALSTIFEVMDVGARADLKSDLLKDLEKQRQILNAFRGNALTDNDWLMSIRSRVGIPGGTCEFDLPAYHAWQHLSGETRRADLRRWCLSLAPMADSVALLLKMLRETGAPQKMMAPACQFQQNLPQGKTFHLLRLRLDASLGLIPEISGNRLMVSIRFMRRGDDDRLHSGTDDCPFELTLCA